MPKKYYLDTHPLKNAFVANRLDRLADLIGEQGELMLRDVGIEFPSRAISTVMLIGERGGISTADIAVALRQPHQLVTQRVTLLIEAGALDRIADPNDGRRKILMLTDKGAKQYDQLMIQLKKVDRVMAALFQEIGYDLSQVAALAIEALKRNSILERLKAQ